MLFRSFAKSTAVELEIVRTKVLEQQNRALDKIVDVVVFDPLNAAKARNVDVLIADTAGRLQNKDNLMQELEKIARVMKKVDPDAPHEVMLTIDAGTGQNAISQVNLFNQCVGLTGITLSKLDGA